MADWEKIKEEFETTDINMKDLAKKHDVKYSTLRSRKSREKWGKDDATQHDMQRNKKQRVATDKITQQLAKNNDLTEKQKKFCLLYLKYFNATKAYQEAYEVSYEVANKNAHALMVNHGVKKELERLKKEQQSELYVESLDIKREWLKQAFADITDYVEFGTEEVTVFNGDDQPVFDEKGEPMTIKKSRVHFKDPNEVDGSLIKEVKMGRDGPVIKLYDKQKALEKIEEFLNLDGAESQDDKISNYISQLKEAVIDDGTE